MSKTISFMINTVLYPLLNKNSLKYLKKMNLEKQKSCNTNVLFLEPISPILLCVFSVIRLNIVFLWSHDGSCSCCWCLC
ncbi:hypothetical protein Hanom_Chr16g01420851 [Helianthus anomalus]